MYESLGLNFHGPVCAGTAASRFEDQPARGSAASMTSFGPAYLVGRGVRIEARPFPGEMFAGRT